MIFIRNKNKEEGFTIIELLISSLIISVGFLTVISLILNVFTATVPLSYNLTASYLTQEAFEVVRRIRDRNFNEKYTLDTPEDEWYWAEGIIPEGEDGPKYKSVHYDSQSLGDNENAPLYLNDEGLFSYDTTGERTTFTREVKVERKTYNYDDGTEAEYLLITVTVNWTEKNNEVKEYKSSTKLFNWYQQT